MAADEKSSKWFRGEGGTVIELDLPLSEEMADQVRLGKMVEVPAPSGDPSSSDPAYPMSSKSLRVAKREPSPGDAKSLWVDYAIAHGMSRAEANLASRAELVEKFGSADKDPRG